MRSPKTSALLLALALAAIACTTGNPPPPPSGGSSSSSGEPIVTRLANGEPLPESCDQATPTRGESVAFVAGGRAWALDPRSGALTCLFDATDLGPFLWGPQGDRVLLNGLQIHGYGDAPTLPGIGVEPTALDWGHPIGIAVVFVTPTDQKPQKFFLEDQRLETLNALPKGQYLDIAYHPSGLALAFVIKRLNGIESVWFSTNEGKQPKRLVFTKDGTTFPDVVFSPDGSTLVWLAHHIEGYWHLHWLNLDDPTTLLSGPKGEIGTTAHGLVMSTTQQIAFTEGEACEDSRALVLGAGRENVYEPLLDEERPTTALGFVGPSTLLVAAGGCGQPTDLYAVPTAGAPQSGDLLVSGVDFATTRFKLPAEPPPLPEGVQIDIGPGIG